jgi:hypothetical protein
MCTRHKVETIYNATWQTLRDRDMENTLWVTRAESPERKRGICWADVLSGSSRGIEPKGYLQRDLLWGLPGEG